jgi:inner membrane protein
VRSLTHQIAGVGLAGLTAAAVDPSAGADVVMVGAAWLGSLLPDADLAGARLYRRTRIERRLLLVRLAGMLVRLPVRPLTLLAHRGPTHSVLACALATTLTGALVWLLDPGLMPAAVTGTAIGYGAHIAADACTPSGVPVWAPFSRRRRWLLPPRARVRTGGAREYLGLALMSVLMLAALTFLG